MNSKSGTSGGKIESKDRPVVKLEEGGSKGMAEGARPWRVAAREAGEARLKQVKEGKGLEFAQIRLT